MVARFDQVRSPDIKEWLLQARRGTAYFARKLRELPDAELYKPSGLDGWSRAHVVAHVGYNARGLARLVNWAETGIETPMYSSPDARNAEIEMGATLSPIALRNLFDHSAIHLNVEWRDLPDAQWTFPVRTAQGREVPVSETVWMRIREVWIHAVDLGNGARFSDFPVAVLERLRAEIASAWESRGEAVAVPEVSGGQVSVGAVGAVSSGNRAEVPSGSLADVVQWMAGRGGPLIERNPNLAPPPRWL